MSKLGLDIEVDRNGFGSQLNSFVSELGSTSFDNLQGVFIRAPRFTKVGENVEVLASFEKEAVLVRQGNFLASSFHPEINNEERIHKLFLEM